MFLDLFVGRLFFFFKQKTAYEMRISDWSSDVCSSDLATMGCGLHFIQRQHEACRRGSVCIDGDDPPVRAKSVERSAKGHRRPLRQRFRLDRQYARLVIACGVEIGSTRISDRRHHMPTPPG